MTITHTPELSAEAYAEKLFTAHLGAYEYLSSYVGSRLGWYESLRTDGPATAIELASRTGTHPRYCREWLEMQASFGTLTADTSSDPDPDRRRFTLPAGAAEVLCDEHSLAFLGALPRMFVAATSRLEELLQVYRDGGGVSWEQFGADARESQAALNRPWFEQRLGPALHASGELESVLAVPGARIADVGCGAGWSTLALARAYPESEVVGFDVDAPAIEMANAAAAGAGLADRVSFRVAGGEVLDEEIPFDAAFAFECLHDMARPIEVLDSVRRSVRPGGLVVVMDEAVADEFESPGNPVDRCMYGFSLFICLPDGLSSSPSAGTGTVFRRPVLESYANRAGYDRVSVLPIEDFGFFRFYRLHR